MLRVMFANAYSAMHAAKSLILLGFTLLVAPFLAGTFVPLTGSFLVDSAVWLVAMLMVLGAQVGVSVAWWRRRGGLSLAAFDELAMEALALLGGGLGGVGCLAGVVFPQPEVSERNLLILGGVGVVLLLAAGWAAVTTVRRARSLVSGG